MTAEVAYLIALALLNGEWLHDGFIGLGHQVGLLMVQVHVESLRLLEVLVEILVRIVVLVEVVLAIVHFIITFIVLHFQLLFN